MVFWGCFVLPAKPFKKLTRTNHNTTKSQPLHNTSLGVTFFFYLLVVVLGYMALGNAVPDNVLLGFHQSPSWVNMLANAMVLVHMISAYQLYARE